jgi:hypothetical protein
MKSEGSLPRPPLVPNYANTRLGVIFRNILVLYSWSLGSTRPTSKLEGHLLSAVRDCLFSVLVAVFNIWMPSPQFAITAR